MPLSKAEQAAIDERRTALIKLRRTKTPFDSTEVLSLGYSSAAAARKDFYRAVVERKEATQAEVSAYREEQNEVLESLFETFMPQALDGDIKAGEMILKLLERQSKLNGWEAVLKAELSGPDGGPMVMRKATLAELNQLIRTVGDTNDDAGESEDGEDPDDDGHPGQD
ncbi:hypothetical protein [Streptomyces asiaticus]|uniref:hypothetical protein n=1 Tax=Streptomyces asiaticus TaxID=114695 RepID=UPI00380C46F4